MKKVGEMKKKETKKSINYTLLNNKYYDNPVDGVMKNTADHLYWYLDPIKNIVEKLISFVNYSGFSAIRIPDNSDFYRRNKYFNYEKILDASDIYERCDLLDKEIIKSIRRYYFGDEEKNGTCSSLLCDQYEKNIKNIGYAVKKVLVKIIKTLEKDVEERDKEIGGILKEKIKEILKNKKEYEKYLQYIKCNYAYINLLIKIEQNKKRYCGKKVDEDKAFYLNLNEESDKTAVSNVVTFLKEKIGTCNNSWELRNLILGKIDELLSINGEDSSLERKKVGTKQMLKKLLEGEDLLRQYGALNDQQKRKKILEYIKEGKSNSKLINGILANLKKTSDFLGKKIEFTDTYNNAFLKLSPDVVENIEKKGLSFSIVRVNKKYVGNSIDCNNSEQQEKKPQEERKKKLPKKEDYNTSKLDKENKLNDEKESSIYGDYEFPYSEEEQENEEEQKKLEEEKERKKDYNTLKGDAENKLNDEKESSIYGDYKSKRNYVENRFFEMKAITQSDEFDCDFIGNEDAYRRSFILYDESDFEKEYSDINDICKEIKEKEEEKKGILSKKDIDKIISKKLGL